MNQQTDTSTYIAEIRKLAKQFDAAAIESCTQLALAQKPNPCFSADTADDVMNVLVKAGFVSSQMAEGLSVGAAIRELGRRMRAVQGA